MEGEEEEKESSSQNSSQTFKTSKQTITQSDEHSQPLQSSLKIDVEEDSQKKLNPENITTRKKVSQDDMNKSKRSNSEDEV